MCRYKAGTERFRVCGKAWKAAYRLFGYIEIINDNGELYVHYRSGSGIRDISDRRKIVFEENYIVLKYDRSIVHFLIECLILFVATVALFVVIGEFIYSVIFAQKVNFDVAMVLLYFWFIWAIKLGPMFYIKKYIKTKIEKN